MVIGLRIWGVDRGANDLHELQSECVHCDKANDEKNQSKLIYMTIIINYMIL